MFKCRLGVADVESLVRGHWPLLAFLDVRKIHLGYKYLRSLAQGQWPELVELRLANNDNSAAEELHQAIWKSLRMLDLVESLFADRTPVEVVHAMLRVFGDSLHTLKVCCEVFPVTALAAAAQQQSWPCKTSLRMDAIARAEVLQSLAHGHWPIRWLLLKCWYTPLPPAIAQLFQIDLTRMESLSVDGLCIGMYTGDPAFRFQDGNWPALKHLALSSCGLQDDFMVQLSSGQWPLLRALDLSSNSLSLLLAIGHMSFGYEQLTEACPIVGAA